MKNPFEAMIEQITSAAIVILDADGTIRSWNAGAREITGYTDREALGRSLGTLLDARVVAQAVKAGYASTQCWLARKHGAPVWTQNVVQRVAATSGAPALCWVCQDPFDN